MDELLALTNRAERTHFWFRGFREFVAPALERAAGGRTNLRLLDCGCGTGHNLGLLTQYGRTFGFDVTASGLAIARKAGRPIARADITRMPYASKTFDIVTSFDVLQCVSDDGAAAAEMARVLKPGGAAVLTVAALDVLRGDHAEFSDEVHRYTRHSARALLQRAGLTPVRIAYTFASLFPLMLGVRTAQRLVRSLRREPGNWEIEVPPAPVNTALAMLVEGEAAIARRLPMPIGSSLLIEARRT
jgi:ubiquinone/menaquinone biosynthesis C-methylase UbiE